MTRQQPKRTRQTSTYGLKPAELRAEMRRLRAAGWADWEIRERFDLNELARMERDTSDA